MPGKLVAVLMVGMMIFFVGGAVVGVTPLRGLFGVSPGFGVAAPALAPAAAPAALAATQAKQGVAPAGGAAVTEVTVTATDLKLTPNAITVPAGAPVRVTFVNQGVIEHDWEIQDLPVKDLKVVSAAPGLSPTLAGRQRDVIAKGIPYAAAGPNGRTVIEFTPTTAGRFAMACLVPGHKEAGMLGSLVVEGPAPAGAQAAAQPAAKAAAQAQPTAAPAAPLPRLPQPTMAAPITGRTAPTTVTLELETREIIATMADGVTYTYWTFDGTVPGPLLRVMQGDTVEVTLKNAPDSAVAHSIDLHAVTGPGGGAKATQTMPGGRTGFTFKALNPGVYVYHCATPMVAHHIANGMYGLIVVEPVGGLPAVDREFYVVQGDFYLQGQRGDLGHRDFSVDKMLDERPDFVVFNGGAGALTGDHALKAKVGETVRIFFGVGGPNLTSSFHVIGEIFDRVHPEGASEPLTNVQTTLVPAGGATVVEFTVEVPGRYILVDHSLGRLEKGGAAFLEVDGPDNPAIFKAPPADPAVAHSGH